MWNKFHLVVVSDPFDILVDSVLQYFIEDIYIYIYKKYWGVLLFNERLYGSLSKEHHYVQWN